MPRRRRWAAQSNSPSELGSSTLPVSSSSSPTWARRALELGRGTCSSRAPPSVSSSSADQPKRDALGAVSSVARPRTSEPGRSAEARPVDRLRHALARRRIPRPARAATSSPTAGRRRTPPARRPERARRAKRNAAIRSGQRQTGGERADRRGARRDRARTAAPAHGWSSSFRASRRFSPIPSTCPSSSIDRSPPCSVRYSTMRSAIVSPMPSSSSRSAAVAVARLIGPCPRRCRGSGRSDARWHHHLLPVPERGRQVDRRQVRPPARHPPARATAAATRAPSRKAVYAGPPHRPGHVHEHHRAAIAPARRAGTPGDTRPAGAARHSHRPSGLSRAAIQPAHGGEDRERDHRRDRDQLPLAALVHGARP